MWTQEELDILGAMAKYGGSFVSRLAEAWMYADASNREKLRETFGDYWNEYKVMVEHKKKRKPSDEAVR